MPSNPAPSPDEIRYAILRAIRASLSDPEGIEIPNCLDPQCVDFVGPQTISSIRLCVAGAVFVIRISPDN